MRYKQRWPYQTLGCPRLVGTPTHSSTRLHALRLISTPRQVLVRIASLKAWPTDAEIAGGGFKDAGQFMLSLKKQSRQVYNNFVSSRAEVGAERQPIWRKLEHLITLSLRIIEQRGSDESADMKLTKKEVHAFVHRDKSKGEGG